jgi:chromosome partitioning protein
MRRDCSSASQNVRHDCKKQTTQPIAAERISSVRFGANRRLDAKEASMEVTCPNCKIKRTIEDNLLPPGKQKITTLCKSCGHRFTLYLDPPESELDAASAAETAGPESASILNAANAASAVPAEPPARPTTQRGIVVPSTTARPVSQRGAPAPARPLTQRPQTRTKAAPKNETRSIGIILSKGGVGKTTTSVNFSAGLAMAGYKVLLVDTDTQGQSGYMLGVKPEYGLADLITKEADPQRAIVKARENLWLLAGGRTLAGIKRLIDRKDFGGELTIAETLGPFEHLFDYVVVDSSPGWDPITVNVLFYVKEILVPVSLEIMSLQGLSEFTKSLATIQKYRGQIGITYILPTFLDEKILSRSEILARLKELYKDAVCQPIRYDPRIAEAPAYGQTIFEYDSGSTGVADYKALIHKITDGGALL